MQKTTLHLTGLQHEQDAQKATQALKDVFGILTVDDVSTVRGEVTFTFDEHAAQLHDFQQRLLECGFDVEGGTSHA